MQRLAELCERTGATTKKTEKVALGAEYFLSCEPGVPGAPVLGATGWEPKDAAISAVFLSGRAFPAFDERTLQIGGSQGAPLIPAFGMSGSASSSTGP
jgi:hypothetical protein